MLPLLVILGITIILFSSGKFSPGEMAPISKLSLNLTTLMAPIVILDSGSFKINNHVKIGRPCFF